MGEGLVLTYAFPAAGTYDVVARITNASSTHGSATSTHALVVGPAVSQVTVPSAPQTVTAVSSAANSVTMGWDAPASTGGAAITGYGITVLNGSPA